MIIIIIKGKCHPSQVKTNPDDVAKSRRDGDEEDAERKGG